MFTLLLLKFCLQCIHQHKLSKLKINGGVGGNSLKMMESPNWKTSKISQQVTSNNTLLSSHIRKHPKYNTKDNGFHFNNLRQEVLILFYFTDNSNTNLKRSY